MKEITILTVSLGNDGAERVLTQLTKQWALDGHKVTILQTNAGKYGCSYELGKNIQIRNVRSSVQFKPVRIIVETLKVIRYLRKHKNTNIISFLPETSFVLALCKPFISNNVIVSERNNPQMCPDGKIQQKMRDFAFLFANVCVFQTEEVRGMFSKSVQNKGIIIRNPINADLPDPFSGERNKVIVTASRLHPQKNLTMLIKAFSKISKEYPEYKLEIYGQGEEEQKLRNLIEKLQLQDKVVLPGFSNNIHEIVNKSSMYVCSSNYEGISNSMLEAMAMGVPTISTDCPIGGSRDMIQTMKNGILIPVGDTKALYTAMKRIISDQQFAESISKESRKIREQYPLTAISQQWVKLMK